MKKYNRIPTMTSNTAPSGIASASSKFATSMDSFCAFDKVVSTSNYWVSVGSSTYPQWLAYEFPSGVVISEYTLVALSYASPNSWEFQGTNDGTTWTTLHTVSNKTDWVPLEKAYFPIDNKNSYKKYRINILKPNADSSTSYTRTVIVEMEMFEYEYDNKFLIQYGDKNISVTKSYLVDLIPTMTSLTSSTGTAFSSNTSDPAWRAFDGVYGVGADTNGWTTSLDVTQGHLGFTFNVAKNVFKYLLYPRTAEQTSAPKAWTFEGSNDNFATFDVLDNKSGISDWKAGVGKEFIIANKNKYKSYRIKVTEVNGQRYIGIGELKMYEYVPSVLIEVPSASERYFTDFGIEKSRELTLSEPIDEKLIINNTSVVLGSGNVFKQKIDTSKYPIKKVSIT